MIAPLSWLKQYVDITLSPETLGDKFTEVGLGCEKITKDGKETTFELEITPNRPDLLSIIGVAREIAALEGKKIRYPKFKNDLESKKGSEILPLKIHPNYKIVPRLTGIILNDVKVKDSPKWLIDRLASIGQQPINNIVDVTNFVMWELGNPIHSFDYHKIAGHEMWVKQAKGGEPYESVDEISYHLPKGAIIYENIEKIFDLVGIKGAANSGTYRDTKAVFIVVEVDDPVLIRRASQALALRTEASSIFERGVNRGGTIDALNRTVDLILETAGGEIASDLIDLKSETFEPWKLSVRIDRLNKILGIEIPQNNIISILSDLNLNPILKKDAIECTIPTYRNDLKIEEDLIEEVARLYGYNNFPKTLPMGAIPIKQIPYFKDFRTEEKIKSVFAACGFSEIYSYSLVSERNLSEVGIDSEKVIRVDNPVSLEFEYLRPTLKIGLLNALKQNKSYSNKIELFELGKAYLGTNVDNAKEPYYLSGISNTKNYYEVKGVLEKVFEEIGVDHDPSKNIELTEYGVFFEINLSELLEKVGEKKYKKFVPVPKYPPIIEDITFEVDPKIKYAQIVDLMMAQSKLVERTELLSEYQNRKTFRITFLSRDRNLTNEDIEPIREKILSTLEKSLHAQPS